MHIDHLKNNIFLGNKALILFNFYFVSRNKYIFIFYNIIILIILYLNISYYNNNKIITKDTIYIILYTLLINNNIIKANIFINNIYIVSFL
jgi:hypothetical protein